MLKNKYFKVFLLGILSLLIILTNGFLTQYESSLNSAVWGLVNNKQTIEIIGYNNLEDRSMYQVVVTYEGIEKKNTGELFINDRKFIFIDNGTFNEKLYEIAKVQGEYKVKAEIYNKLTNNKEVDTGYITKEVDLSYSNSIFIKFVIFFAISVLFLIYFIYLLLYNRLY